jgi:multiple sugar transport system ATP-binding protein
MRILLRNLCKSFGSHPVVRDLTLEIAKGELLVLLGPSGCGKTTTLRMLAGLETPDTGEIEMDGRAVTHLPPRDRDLAMVFQSYALYPHLSVAENIGFPLRVRGVAAPEIGPRVADVARRLGLDALLARRPRQLSGGQRQRVALARAIVRQPNAFLMDEPLSNLDARLRVETRAELKHLQHELGATTVYVTHDQTEAMVLGHRIAIMNEGVLQQAATPAAVYERPANRFVAGFVGSPPMNFVEGRADGMAGVFKAGELAIFLGREAAVKAEAAGAASFGIRPEHLTVLTHPSPGSLPARVYVSEPVGSDTYLVLQAGAHRLTARAQAGTAYTFDQAVWCIPDPQHLYFFTATGQTIL